MGTPLGIQKLNFKNQKRFNFDSCYLNIIWFFVRQLADWFLVLN